MEHTFPIQKIGVQILATSSNDVQNVCSHYLAWRSALLAQDEDWLTQNEDNMTEFDIEVWCWRPDLPVGHNYKFIMGGHCHKSVSAII